MWPLKTTLYFGLFWIGCAVSLANPIWGVVNYMLVYQLDPQTTWWGLPLARLGIRFSFLAALFTAIGLFTGYRFVPRVRPLVSAWEVGLALLVAIASVTLMIGYGYNAASAFAFEKFWKMSLFVLLLGRLATTRRNLKIVLWALVVGSLYVGYDAYTAQPSAFWGGRLDLIGGPDFSTTSGTGAHLAAMLPLIGVVLLTTPRWTGRVLAALAGLFSANTIILCRTRSAFIGLLCGACVALLAAPHARRYRLYVLLGLAGAAAFGLTDNYFWKRMSTLTNEEAIAADAAVVSRTEIWQASAAMLADHPLGVGTGNFPRVIGTYHKRYASRSAHNTLIVCFTELGVQGGLVFLLLWAAALRFLFLSWKLADTSDAPVETKLMAYGLLVALVTYTVAGLGTERFYCESYWWVLVLPLCLYRTVLNENRDASLPRFNDESVGTVSCHEY